MYPSFSVFGKEISVYGILGLIGFLLAIGYVYLTNRGKKAGTLPKDDILNIAGMVIVGIFIGGKTLGFFVDIPIAMQFWSQISGDWIRVLAVLFGSFVFYGGLIGAIVSTVLYCRRYSISLSDTSGLFVPAIPLFHAVARIGCFMVGCCWGMEVENGFSFTKSPVAPNDIPLLPIQLIEACFNFLLFIFLAILCRRIQDRMDLLPIYFICYGTARFIIEFFRGDKVRGIFFGLSTSQWISIALLLIAFMYFLRKKKKQPDPIPTG